MTHAETENVYEYTIFRAVLVLLVVLGHCSYLSIFSNYGNFDVIGESLIPLGQKLLYFPTYIIYSFHMPAFIFLSGTMFELHKTKYIQERKIFLYKKAKRLQIPFFLITLLYIVPIKYIVGYWNNSSNVLQDIFLGQFLIQGNNSLWFLEVLFIIFCLCLPFLFYNVDKKFYLIIFISSLLISIFSGIVHIQLISLTLKYFCFFVFGIIFEQNREKFNSWLFNKKILFLLVIIYSCFIGIKFLSKNSSIPYINSVISTFVAFAGIVVLWGGVRLYSCTIRSHFLEKISELSMGIYLYSDTLNYLILSTLLYFGLFRFFNNPWLPLVFYFLRFVLTLSMSILITTLFKKLKLKYLY